MAEICSSSPMKVETASKTFSLCRNNTNLTEVTKKFGIVVNSDCVIRTSFYKYFHPKEAYIHNGILNEEVTRVANGYAKEPKGRGNNGFLLGGREED